jgi:serine/threonine-protein kinase RsbW
MKQEDSMEAFERKFLIQVPSSTANLVLIREFVSGVGNQAGLTSSEIGKLELAVDEACANVIEHAYQHDMTKEVVVRAAFDETALRIVVEDTGRGFDPSSVPAARVDQLIALRRSGGLGLELIRKIMDEVHYEMDPGRKNELSMVMRLRKPVPMQ